MKKIKPYMQKLDDRGKILGITQEFWAEINYIESKKGTARGNHYHKQTVEAFYIISGKIKVVINNIKSGKIQKVNAIKGDIFVINPYEKHTFTVLEDSSWINMLSKSMKDGEDFYKI